MNFNTFEVIEYIKMRLQDENANESLIEQLIELVHDRLLLRLQEESLPSCFLSIMKDDGKNAESKKNFLCRCHPFYGWVFAVTFWFIDWTKPVYSFEIYRLLRGLGLWLYRTI